MITSINDTLLQLYGLFAYDACNYRDRFIAIFALDKAICPFIVKRFDLPFFHPTCEWTLDSLLDAQIDL
jgi:hypothetical protein